MLSGPPTVAEYLPGYEATSWYGLGAPKGTPQEIIRKLNTEVQAILADPKTKARFLELGATMLPGTPAEFGKLVADETDKWGKVVTFSGAKVLTQTAPFVRALIARCFALRSFKDVPDLISIPGDRAASALGTIFATCAWRVWWVSNVRGSIPNMFRHSQFEVSIRWLWNQCGVLGESPSTMTVFGDHCCCWRAAHRQHGAPRLVSRISSPLTVIPLRSETGYRAANSLLTRAPQLI